MPEEPQDTTPKLDNDLQNVEQQPSDIIQDGISTSSTDEQPRVDLQSDDSQWQGKIVQPIHSDLKLSPQTSFRTVRPARATYTVPNSNTLPESAPDSDLVTPTTSATSATSADPAPNNQMFNTSSTPKKGKKKLIIGIVVAAIITLGIGGGAFAAYSWYQNPQKVVTDSLINAFTAKTSIYTGSIKAGNDFVEVAVDITAKKADSAAGSLDAKVTVTVENEDYKVNGSALIDASGDLYFKIDNLEDIVNEYKNQLGVSEYSMNVSSAIDKIVKKIDGTWIRISSDDLKEYSDDYASSKTCINDTIKKYKDDKVAIAEITDLYKENQLFIIDRDLGQKDGSFGYGIKGSDNVTLKSFLNGLKNTEIYKSLHSCDDDFVIDTNDIDVNDINSADDEVTVELWVDVWSHQITKIILDNDTDDTKLSATITPEYNQKIEIATPSSSITLTELQTYIEDLTDSMSCSSENTTQCTDTYVM